MVLGRARGVTAAALARRGEAQSGPIGPVLCDQWAWAPEDRRSRIATILGDLVWEGFGESTSVDIREPVISAMSSIGDDRRCPLAVSTVPIALVYGIRIHLLRDRVDPTTSQKRRAVTPVAHPIAQIQRFSWRRTQWGSCENRRERDSLSVTIGPRASTSTPFQYLDAANAG